MYEQREWEGFADKIEKVTEALYLHSPYNSALLRMEEKDKSIKFSRVIVGVTCTKENVAYIPVSQQLNHCSLGTSLTDFLLDL